MEKLKGIRKRGNAYVVDVTLGGQRVSRSAATLDEAILLRSQLRDRMTKGLPVDYARRDAEVDNIPLSKAVDLTMKTRWRGSRQEGTVIHYCNSIESFFGKATLVSEITTRWIDEYVEDLEDRGNSPATINRKLSALSVILKTCVERGYLSNPPAMPKRKREGKGRIKFFTKDEEDQITRLMDQWGKADHAQAVRVLVDTGLRTSELWGLKWEDVNLESNLIHVWENKADHPRSVPMTQRVRSIMAQQKAKYGEDRGPFPFDNHWMRHTWDRVRDHLGKADDIHWVAHTLRHTTASRLVQKGVSLPVVQQILGHKTITTTMRYAHLSPVQAQEAIKVLEG